MPTEMQKEQESCGRIARYASIQAAKSRCQISLPRFLQRQMKMPQPKLAWCRSPTASPVPDSGCQGIFIT